MCAFEWQGIENWLCGSSPPVQFCWFGKVRGAADQRWPFRGTCSHSSDSNMGKPTYSTTIQHLGIILCPMAVQQVQGSR